jgi:hypothetical protein
VAVLSGIESGWRHQPRLMAMSLSGSSVAERWCHRA